MTESAVSDTVKSLHEFLEKNNQNMTVVSQLQNQIIHHQMVIDKLEKTLKKAQEETTQLKQLNRVKDNKLLILQNRLNEISLKLESGRKKYIAEIENSRSWKIGYGITRFIGAIIKWIPFLKR